MTLGMTALAVAGLLWRVAVSACGWRWQLLWLWQVHQEAVPATEASVGFDCGWVAVAGWKGCVWLWVLMVAEAGF